MRQQSSCSTTDRNAGNGNYLVAIRHQIASTLIGRTVDLLADTKTVAHGIVTGVLNEGGVDKLVVGGSRYDLNQILTVTPACFN
jgi:hypothetical protein